MKQFVAVNDTPEKPYIYLGEEELSFAEVNRLVAATLAWINGRAELRRGDRVAILMPMGLSSALALLALLRIGAVSVPLNSRLTTGELKWQIRNCDCRLLLTQADSAVHAGELDVDLLEMPPLGLDGAPATAGDYGKLDLKADCALIHSSGTSGRPKAAVLTGGNMYYSAVASALRLGSLRRERWLCVLPLYHVGGLSIVLRSLIYGTAVDLMPFDVSAVNAALSDKPITLVSLVPTMLQGMLDAKKRSWNPRLRLILLGGEAASADLLARCAAENLPIATTYGLTEAASQVATATPDLARQKPGSSGKALQFSKLRVIDVSGAAVPAGVPGEVLVKGPTVMRGYYGDAFATENALRGGWLHTGDIGYLDEDGDLFILQRRADLIVSGGENIYPAEVEAALRQHPAVAEAVVFGLADEVWGQRVGAVLECRGVARPSSEAIVAFAREKLAGYKIPRQIAFVEALPRTPSGKIQRREARRIFDDAVSSR